MGFFSDLKDNVLGIDPNGKGIFTVIDDLTGKSAQKDLKADAQARADEMAQFLEMLRPTIDAGQAQIDPLAESATVGGFGANIGEILSGGALNPLIDQRQRSADAQMAARGLRRSGGAIQEAANIPADLAMQIENELNRRRQSISGAGQTGLNQAAGIQQGIGSILSGANQQGLQARAGGLQNVLGGLGAGLAAFSDSRLKDNINQIGELGGLPVVSWDWNDAAYDAYGLEGSSTGFIAQDVKRLYPSHVSEVSDGTLVINYDALLKEVKNG